jgi:hypothetical protein
MTTPIFVIVSKLDKLPHPDNFESIHNYFELGWEMGASRIDCLHLIATGQIEPKTHTVVTLNGREFLYRTLMPVARWEDWAAERGIVDASRLPKEGILDLTNFYASTASVDWSVFHGGPQERYRHEDLVRPLYDRFEAPDVTGMAAAPFFLCCWRYRNSHHRERNTPKATAVAIHDLLLKKGGVVYVVGVGAEDLCDGRRVVHVPLPTFCALAKHPNCRAAVGAMTGTMQFAAIICRSKIVVYQHNRQEPVNTQNHPVVLGECVNFHRNKRLIQYEPVVPLPIFLQRLDKFL